MSLNENQKEALNKLYSHRESIENHLAEIEVLIQVYFPEEFAVAYQHWLPQIKTALNNNTKWLPRGQYSMEYTLNHLVDKIIDDVGVGITKAIK